MNIIKVCPPVISGSSISVEFSVSEDLARYFQKDTFRCEYNTGLENLPASIAVIPFLCNVLPIAWLTDAVIEIDSLDYDFYNSIDLIRNGYKDMYPMLSFGGRVKVNDIVRNTAEKRDAGNCAAFFSGGVDAFATLFSHLDERPSLITLWGADIKLDDTAGWNIVRSHVTATAEKYGLDCLLVKSNFREFIDYGELQKLIDGTNESWWHGFQHGIGIIGHGAPVAYALDLNRIYIASSFTIADKGRVTCASDPTIDNYVHYCGCRTIHDGYEMNRQQKVDLICDTSDKLDSCPTLRVCWISSGGKNCCECEKCFRTAFSIIAAGHNPADYGLDISKRQYKKSRRAILMVYALNRRSIWKEIQSRIKELPADSIPGGARWIRNCDLDKECRSISIRYAFWKPRAITALKCSVAKALRILHLR